MIHYKQFVFNAIQVNTWVVYNEDGDCIIFDPGCQNEGEQHQLSSFITDHQLSPSLVVATHGHFDHIPGVEFVKNQYHCQLAGHQADQLLLDHAKEQGSLFGFDLGSAALALDQLLDHGDDLVEQGLSFKVLHVPGHSLGSLAFYCEAGRFVIVGDVLFQGSIGRTDLPGGNYETLIESIQNHLMTLPDETAVLCGHGPITKIGIEKKTNPFL